MRRQSTLLPEQQLDAVIAALYADAHRLDWEHLPLQERTRQYARWVSDPRVGGVLTAYMTSEQARSWIKDGPMKEYGRARRGTGRYARFGPSSATGPRDIVRYVLGPRWTVIDDTVGDKPFHCQATHADERVYLAWGRAANFRHLVWAALRSAVDTGGRAIVIVTESPERPTPEDVVAWHRRIAARCALETTHMRESLAAPGRSTPDQWPAEERR